MPDIKRFSYVEGSATVMVGGDLQVGGGATDPQMENLE